MGKIIIIAMISIAAWYGHLYYTEGNLPFIENFESQEKLKCITKEGKTLYGKIPSGTVCEKLEPVKGSLTILPSKEFSRTSGSNNSRSKTSRYKCDGRTYCSQMKSCGEATFFLNNCPNVKMDGNHDGIPCEKQWC